MMIANFLLAQISLPDPDAFLFGYWIVHAAAILAIGYMITKIVIMFRRRPPIDAEFATKRELNLLQKQSDGRDDKIEEQITEMRQEIKSDIGGVHKRVDEILKGVSRLEGKLS